MSRKIKKCIFVFISLLIFVLLNCTTIPCSNLESPVIEKGVGFGVGMETLNREFNDFVKDSLGSNLEVCKSSALILKFSRGGETFITTPPPERIKWEWSLSTHCLYPHPTVDEILFDNVGENEVAPGESIFQDLVWNMRFHGKVSRKNIAVSASYVPFATGFKVSPIISVPTRNKSFIPYVAPCFTFSDVIANRYSISLGFSSRLNDNLEILGEGTFVHSSLYDTVGGPPNFPVFAIFIRHLSR